MLASVGLITGPERDRIVAGLESIGREIASGRFRWDAALEDVHMNVEAALTKRIGEAGKKLHTGRSRNDQVAADLRLWARSDAARTDGLIRVLQRELAAKASKWAGVAFPGYTHLQRAQPVTAGHWALSYVEALERDRGRLADCARRANASPLGAGALAGSTLPLDRGRVARELGFDGVMRNSMDAVAERDFLAEHVFALSMTAVHLSRLAEDLVVYSTGEFGIVRLDEAFTTGSSIMPQKRNPDVAELIRGKCARAVGALAGMMTLLKGLPSTYDRDLQEDKTFAFDASDAVGACLEVAAPMVRTMSVDAKAAARALEGSFAEATAVAEHLVTQGVPFREAHRMVGELVKRCEREGRGLASLGAVELRRALPGATREVACCLGAESVLRRYRTEGSANPGMVRREARRWLRLLALSRRGRGG
jgi:argininosuccinate lyase